MFERGLYLSRGQIKSADVGRLRQAFYDALAYCDAAKARAFASDNMQNTVHHCLFLADIFGEVVTGDENWKIVSNFFDDGKFVLNSLGGNNNCHENVNYASDIHRDVRFFTSERMCLNTIICVSPINEGSGATELFLAKDHSLQKGFNESESEKYILNAEPGDVFYFDSRIWHRAGVAQHHVTERIIFTPIYTRPFIKPGFNYAKQLQGLGVEKFSDRIKQLCGYYSDVPESHEQWYGGDGRRFYQKEQDVW